jgi:hypothetical protein
MMDKACLKKRAGDIEREETLSMDLSGHDRLEKLLKIIIALD